MSPLAQPTEASVDDVSFSAGVFVVDGNLDRAIRELRASSGQIRFELMKRLRYGPKPSVKRKNKHRYRHDGLNPLNGRLARSGSVPQLDKYDRCSGKGVKKGPHWY